MPQRDSCCFPPKWLFVCLSVCLSVLCRLFSHWDQESEVHTSYRTGTVRTSEEEDLHDKHSQTLIDLFNEYCSVSVLCPQAAI